jgi:Fic family protein
MMGGRPEKLPGEYKNIVNRVGTKIFVDPSLVRGTLKQGFDMYQSLREPFHRALFMMFLVAEVHPFMDGNGRIARIMMNAELSSANEFRIIIPTIYRNNYLASLRALSQSRAEPYLRTLDFAQKYTAALDWSSYETSRLELERTHAFMDSSEADFSGIRLILPG